ncbi:RDD family protein [Lentzea sp. NPDC092896]|uniref:RDD family protein n=1 Tax=Lentzea sp. NPDC092896 TaxID=3364127 RepID=UPI003828431F
MALDAEARSIVLRRYSQHVIEFALLVVAAVLGLVPGFLLSLGLVKLGMPAEHFPYVAVSSIAIVSLLGVLWIEIWYPYRHGGSTPAMRWLGIRITTLRGGEPSLRDYFVRWLLMVVDGLFMGLVGAVLIAVTPRHQRLGDMVAGTVVVRRPAVT